MIRNLVLLLIAGLWLNVAQAGEVFQLTPADPQPAADKLKPGLSVGYVYREVKWLDEAKGYRSHILARNQKTLKGFMYGNTDPGEKILTADASEYVIAFIEGFMRFEAGTHDLEFQSNDGLRVFMSGKKVYEKDGRFTCQSAGAITVKIPETGWYPVKALFFQRRNTACLDLSVRPQGGNWDWTEEAMYAHLPK